MGSDLECFGVCFDAISQIAMWNMRGTAVQGLKMLRFALKMQPGATGRTRLETLARLCLSLHTHWFEESSAGSFSFLFYAFIDIISDNRGLKPPSDEIDLYLQELFEITAKFEEDGEIYPGMSAEIIKRGCLHLYDKMKSATSEEAKQQVFHPGHRGAIKIRDALEGGDGRPIHHGSRFARLWSFVCRCWGSDMGAERCDDAICSSAGSATGRRRVQVRGRLLYSRSYAWRDVG